MSGSPRLSPRLVVWLLAVLFLGQVPRLLRKADQNNTGWPWLATEDLTTARNEARASLRGIKRGSYQVSLGLAKRTKKYEWVSCAWWQNEFGKFFRSLVFPLCVVSWIVREQWSTFALAAVCVLIAFSLYWRLKGWHMCRVYVTAKGLTKGPSFDPTPHEVTKGQWVFSWKGKVVGQGEE